MAKRIIWICVIILIGVSIYYGVKQYQNSKQGTDGAVKCTFGCETPEEKARFELEDRGDTPDGNSERKQRTARQEASAVEAGFPAGTGPATSNDPAHPAQPYGTSQGAPNIVAPGQKSTNGSYALSNNATTGNSMSTTPDIAPENQLAARQPALAPVDLPITDSRSPNAPNGLAFAGSGSYQWYRQGNLTWRIDTNTGRSCIIYATMQEWQKRIVFNNGCGRNG